MSKAITAHQLAKILLEGPDDPVIVNGGDHIEETKPLTEDDIKPDSKEAGGSTGGPFVAKAWISLGTL
jgi:hypothetical protein